MPSTTVDCVESGEDDSAWRSVSFESRGKTPMLPNSLPCSPPPPLRLRLRHWTPVLRPRLLTSDIPAIAGEAGKHEKLEHCSVQQCTYTQTGGTLPGQTLMPSQRSAARSQDTDGAYMGQAKEPPIMHLNTRDRMHCHVKLSCV